MRGSFWPWGKETHEAESKEAGSRSGAEGRRGRISPTRDALQLRAHLAPNFSVRQQKDGSLTIWEIEPLRVASVWGFRQQGRALMVGCSPNCPGERPNVMRGLM